MLFDVMISNNVKVVSPINFSRFNIGEKIYYSKYENTICNHSNVTYLLFITPGKLNINPSNVIKLVINSNVFFR